MSRSLNYRKYSLFTAQGLAMALVMAAVARCSSTSGNVVTPPASSGSGSGASGSGSTGSGASSGDVANSGSSNSGTSTSGDSTSGAGTSGTGSSGTSSSGDDGGTTVIDAGNGMGPDGGCLATGTTSVHVKLAVSWAKTTVLVGGSGMTDLWFKATSTLSGNALTVTNRACGVTLPDFQTDPTLAGGEKIQLKFPDAMWDNPNMPVYHATGTQTGSGPGATQVFAATPTLFGLNPMGSTSKYATASTTWPAPPPANMGTFPQFMASELSDDDGDHHPGVTLTPSGSSPYNYPPTTLDFAHNQADKLYVVTRTTVALNGTLNSCFGASGTATVSEFENHVVGCEDATGTSSSSKPLSGTNCSMTSGTTGGPGFLDVNRTIFTPGAATYTSVPVPEDATCAVVRSAN